MTTRNNMRYDLKKNIVVLSVMGILAAATAWAGFGHIGHIGGHPIVRPAEHFFPGHPGIVHGPGHVGPVFTPWHPGYERRYAWPVWYAAHECARYEFNWSNLREVTCTAQDKFGEQFHNHLQWHNSWTMENQEEVQQSENNALIACDRGLQGQQGCFLVGCSPIYR